MWALALLVAVSPEAPIGIAVVSSVQLGTGGRTSGAEVEADLRRAIGARPSLRAEPITSAVRDRIAACGASVQCMSSALIRDGYGLCLRVAADQRFTPAVFTAQLIDANAARVLDEIVGEAGEGQALREVLAERVGALLERAGHARLARLELQLSGVSGQLRIDPPPVSGDDSGYWLTEGPYRVISEDGTTWPVEAVAGRTSSLRVAAEAAPTSSSPWLWITIAAVVAAGAATSIGIAAASAGGGDCLCLAAPGATCPPCP